MTRRVGRHDADDTGAFPPRLDQHVPGDPDEKHGVHERGEHFSRYRPNVADEER